jgi:ABC-2 type transport system ATP-binding protein
MKEDKMKIEIEQVNKTFGKETVLSGVNLSIESGKIFCLLGASGSGKTTLLQIIMGALPAESGRVIIGNIPVPNRELLSAIGYMPQNVGLYEELSIWDNLRFFAGIQGLRRKAFIENANRLMGIVDLHEEKKKLVRDCSGGMKKRISLAVALIHKPSLLLLDEPTVGIDPILRKKIWTYLKDLRSKGTTIIVTTHVMDEISECDDAGLLRNGRIIAAESVENLIRRTPNGKIEELFLMDEATGEEGSSC